jgi:hypothetical protein
MVRAKKNAKEDPSFRTLKADYYPVQRTINLGSSPSGTTTNQILDVARCLSVVNHRLYRQGKTYQVKIDLDNRPDETNPGMASIDVYALVDTWYIQKAWQLARATYLRSTADERQSMSKQKIARWEDFRVGAGVATPSTNVLPYRYSTAFAGANDSDGEFDLSEITLADGTTQRNFTWGSTASLSLGMLEEYNKTGDTDLAPSTVPAGNAYAGTDPGVHESQMDDLALRGNAPPYNATDFSGRVWVKVATLDNSAAASPSVQGGHSRMTTGYFNAPCGLVILRPSVPDTSLDGLISMTVKAGDYKGVAAMNMGA